MFYFKFINLIISGQTPHMSLKLKKISQKFPACASTFFITSYTVMKGIRKTAITPTTERITGIIDTAPDFLMYEFKKYIANIVAKTVVKPIENA